MAIATSINVKGVSKKIATGRIPIRAASALEWGCEYPIGKLTSNIIITLPAISYSSDGYGGDVEITAYQPANGSYTITINAPSGSTITDGDTDTSSIVYTPEAGNTIEINVKPVSSNQISALSNMTVQTTAPN